MSKKEPNDVLMGMRDTILATALQFKKDKLGADGKGKLSGYDLNAFSGAMKAAGYIESLRANIKSSDMPVNDGAGDLSEASKKKLDELIELLKPEKPKTRGKRGKKAPKEAEP